MTVKFIGTEFEPKKMHLYDCKTTGKHPVHLIEGGEYITEDERSFETGGCSDMGWFFLNTKEYNYFKSQCKEIELDLEIIG